MAEEVTVACVGAGYWGKNLVRVFDVLPDAVVAKVCDRDPEIRRAVTDRYPDIAVVEDYREVVDDPDVDGVVIAVPAVQHHEAAMQALERGKHVYVEKPMTLGTREARELVDTAARSDRILMVGHLLMYHPAVTRLKEYVDSGELGDVYYLYSQRVNLGIVRKDENALWSLAPHDISVVLHLLGELPARVSAHGQCYLQGTIEDVVFVNMHYGDGRIAHLHLSWLDPHKTRKLTVVGNRRMAVFDDEEGTEKLRIYDKGVESTDYDSYGDALTLHLGDVVIPHIRMSEPLMLEAQHFVECVREGRRPLSDGENGMHVVQVLEAAQTSLRNNGTAVDVSAA
ncbi:MAG: hypothetical protein CL484_03790 [Acidobacteria bacterium]|nr:hypothetical protein [Acidobacteriota bacterium]